MVVAAISRERDEKGGDNSEDGEVASDGVAEQGKPPAGGDKRKVARRITCAAPGRREKSSVLIIIRRGRCTYSQLSSDAFDSLWEHKRNVNDEWGKLTEGSSK
jgi:hypothetical protein